jgi:hypothetical protein
MLYSSIHISTHKSTRLVAHLTHISMDTRHFGVLMFAAGLALSGCSEPTSSKAGPPATITFVSGNEQTAFAGTPVPAPPVAQVKDKAGRGVPGVSVVFTVVEGEGSIASTAPVTTDEEGNAPAPQWTLGRAAIPQSLRASTSDGAINGSATATVATSYNLEVRFFGPAPSAAASAAFALAAARIRGAVTGDVPDEVAEAAPRDLSDPTQGCGVAGLPTFFREAIDDLLIFATVEPIDGPNNVLASAFPCFIRDAAPNQAVIGVMRFDSEDLENLVARGILTDVVTHEMLHVVGIGTLWNFLGLVQDAGTSQTRYTGALGVGGCVDVGGASVCPGSIPLEPLTDAAGEGTADSHWSESVFFNELMTGFVNTRASVPTGPINPFSLMSIRSLADIGYTVNANAADPYTVPHPASVRVQGQLNVGAPGVPWERVQRPRFRITRSGRTSPIVRQ